MERGIRTRSLLAAMVCAALIVLGWNFVTLRTRILRAFTREDQLQSDIVLTSNALKLQLYEAAGMRDVSGDLDATLRQLRDSLNGAGLSAAASAAQGALERAPDARRSTAQLRFRAEMRVIMDELLQRVTTTRQDIVQVLQRLFLVDITSLFVIVGIFALAWTRERRLIASLVRTEQAYEREREVAKEKTYLALRLQELYVHEELPRPAGIALSSWYEAAEEEMHIGGDWYIAVSLDDDHLLFGVGDVTGHGLEAALTMGRIRRLILTAALVERDPAGILRRLNFEMLKEGQIASAFLGVLTFSQHRMTYAIAGHPPPVLVAPDGNAALLATDAVPLGIESELDLHSLSARLDPGSRIVLCTDGLLEFNRAPVEAERTLLQACEELSEYNGGDLAERIARRVLCNAPARDDVAVLCLSALRQITGDAIGRAAEEGDRFSARIANFHVVDAGTSRARTLRRDREELVAAARCGGERDRRVEGDVSLVA
jgi:hypothetical protein